jgi:hypothetical protein
MLAAVVHRPVELWKTARRRAMTDFGPVLRSLGR